MGSNKRQLQQDKKYLTKAKAPSKPKDVLYTEQGQWRFPGQVTKIPSNRITMQGVDYPVTGVDDTGYIQHMLPGQEYMFPGNTVTEYPHIARKGGSVHKDYKIPKPTKKGLNSKAYSRSLQATNRLFLENPLFAKPKSKKSKIFDPKAKYYQNGGESDDYVYLDNLLPEEIEEYAKGGYVIEDVSIPTLNQKQRGGQTIAIGEVYKYSGRPDSEYKMNEDGKWTIKNASTHNKFVPIKDPTGSRSAELERNAISETDFFIEQKKRNKELLKEIKNPKSFITLEDPRTIRATSGQKINPNVDLMSGKYNEAVIKNIIKKAKSLGVDPATAVAIALQESRIGQTDPSLGHLLHGESEDPYAYINFYKQKLKEAKRAGINDELLQIQYYNGLGTVTPKTEKKYHGYEMQKIYGVPIPKSGINMRENPLYGKQIVDLRDNVIKRNKQIQKYLKNVKEEGGEIIVDNLSEEQLQKYLDGGYIIEKID